MLKRLALLAVFVVCSLSPMAEFARADQCCITCTCGNGFCFDADQCDSWACWCDSDCLGGNFWCYTK